MKTCPEQLLENCPDAFPTEQGRPRTREREPDEFPSLAAAAEGKCKGKRRTNRGGRKNHAAQGGGKADRTRGSLLSDAGSPLTNRRGKRPPAGGEKKKAWGRNESRHRKGGRGSHGVGTQGHLHAEKRSSGSKKKISKKLSLKKIPDPLRRVPSVHWDWGGGKVLLAAPRTNFGVALSLRGRAGLVRKH